MAKKIKKSQRQAQNRNITKPTEISESTNKTLTTIDSRLEESKINLENSNRIKLAEIVEGANKTIESMNQILAKAKTNIQSLSQFIETGKKPAIIKEYFLNLIKPLEEKLELAITCMSDAKKCQDQILSTDNKDKATIHNNTLKRQATKIQTEENHISQNCEAIEKIKPFILDLLKIKTEECIQQLTDSTEKQKKSVNSSDKEKEYLTTFLNFLSENKESLRILIPSIPDNEPEENPGKLTATTEIQILESTESYDYIASETKQEIPSTQNDSIWSTIFKFIKETFLFIYKLISQFFTKNGHTNDKMSQFANNNVNSNELNTSQENVTHNPNLQNNTQESLREKPKAN